MGEFYRRRGGIEVWTATGPFKRWFQPAWSGPRPKGYRGGFAIKIGRNRILGVTRSARYR